MLELLLKYAVDHGLEPEPGFKSKDVRWAIVCDSSGRFLDVVELGEVGASRNPGKNFAKSPDLSQGELIAGGTTRSHFLVDTAEVVACYDPKAEKSGYLSEAHKAAQKHQYFIKLLREAASAMPGLTSLADCLSDSYVTREIRDRLKAHKVKPTDKVTFRLGSTFPLESDQWHEWWREFRTDLSAGSSADKIPARKGLKQTESLMRCFATSELGKPMATHPKIEGLADVGGIASGDVLIGFDKEAFRSYGLEQSANAAVTEEGAAAYRAALNELIRKHGQRLAGARIVHWFQQKVEQRDDPLAWLVEGADLQELDAEERARQLLHSIRTGKRTDLMTNRYYALTLSGAAGRVMVRDWMEGQFEDLVQNVSDWFRDLAIIRRDGGGLAASPKFLAVMGATVRDLKDLPGPFVAKMWRVAARAESVPRFALAQALLRTRAGIMENEAFNHARMGLLKAYHLRNNRQIGGNQMTEDLKPDLNENHPSLAYQCGRLMAILAELQRRALGDVGTGVVQRYYAAASTTPALVLGRITRLSQFHLNKLESPLARWYETKIAGIWGRLKNGPPRTLDLEEQSLFALGYYQQIADMRTKKSGNSTDKEGGKNE